MSEERRLSRRAAKARTGHKYLLELQHKVLSLRKNRPHHLIAVVGTHANVGKTWAASQLLRYWRAKGFCVAARKPIQSFEGKAVPTDADLLAIASGEDVHVVCPPHRWYPQALPPPIAADDLGRPRIKLNELLAEMVWPADTALGLVDTVGGVCSPIAHDGYSADLVLRLRPDRVLVVADAGLGTINAIRMTLQCLGKLPTVVFLNRFEPRNRVHLKNYHWLRTQESVLAVTSIEALISEP